MENIFYAKNFNDKKIILLIGSSHVGRVNATFIDNYLILNNEKYNVYNLAIPQDSPRDRLSTIDKIILMKPKMVVYGIGYRDFSDLFVTKPRPTSILPDFQTYFQKKLYDLSYQYGLEDFSCPQCVFLTVFRNSFGNSEIAQQMIESNTPFYKYNLKEQSVVKNDKGLEDELANNPNPVGRIDPFDQNKNVEALKEIILKLQKNGIKVIFFITPHSKYYLNSVNDENTKNFNDILNYISSNFGSKIYDLRNKYVDLNIWSDMSHVAMNEDGLIYSEDIAKIIKNELEQNAV